MLKFTKSPFLGMNPYLENPQLWRGFHTNLASEIAAQLTLQLADSYAALVEVDLVIASIHNDNKRDLRPDTVIIDSSASTTSLPVATMVASAPTARREVLEILPEKVRRVVIKLAETNEVVTLIEILSPTNKRGEGLVKYRQKRHDILLSDTHLVEIDLLRSGIRPGKEVDEADLAFDYALVVNRTGLKRISDIWHVTLDNPLPNLPIPLLYPDEDVVLNMTQLIEQVMVRYSFTRVIDYDKPIPNPKLRPEIAQWWEQRRSKLVASG